MSIYYKKAEYQSIIEIGSSPGGRTSIKAVSFAGNGFFHISTGVSNSLAFNLV